jgi:pyruvoyl-dependent arginine decarboxylase (PvlArgDC)
VNLSSPANSSGASSPQTAADLRVLFHRLNNQLGIILAHAELMEAKATDDVARARAAQVVSSVLDAMGTVREIRSKTEPAEV